MWDYEIDEESSNLKVAISSDGKHITAGFQNDKIYLFDKISSVPLWNYDVGDDIHSISISSDGEYIAVAADSPTNSEVDNVYVFDKDSNTPLWSYDTGVRTNIAISNSEP